MQEVSDLDIQKPGTLSGACGTVKLSWSSARLAGCSRSAEFEYNLFQHQVRDKYDVSGLGTALI